MFWFLGQNGNVSILKTSAWIKDSSKVFIIVTDRVFHHAELNRNYSWFSSLKILDNLLSTFFSKWALIVYPSDPTLTKMMAKRYFKVDSSFVAPEASCIGHLKGRGANFLKIPGPQLWLSSIISWRVFSWEICDRKRCGGPNIVPRNYASLGN